MFKKLFNKFMIPFAIIHIRIIQWRYKKISYDEYNQTSYRSHKLILLQAKEEYYYSQFDSWGKFHPEFAYNEKTLQKHRNFLNWLFPEKDFNEWDSVVWHKYKAITYYHNKIFRLQNGVSSMYANEIKKQLKEWNTEVIIGL